MHPNDKHYYSFLLMMTITVISSNVLILNDLMNGKCFVAILSFILAMSTFRAGVHFRYLSETQFDESKVLGDLIFSVQNLLQLIREECPSLLMKIAADHILMKQ